MWLSAGDKNTRFFHLRASLPRRKNKISKLKKPNGQVVENEEEMGALATEFYKTLYQSEGTHDMERVLDTVPIKVTAGMNEGLLAPFEKEEVKTALFQMFPTKAPGRMACLRTFSSVIGIASLGSLRGGDNDGSAQGS